MADRTSYCENGNVVRKMIYIAGPLFSEAECFFNERLEKCLSRWMETYLPQRDGGLVANILSEGKSIAQAYEKVFKEDCMAIDKCDYFLIVLDGRTVDEGAAFELGYAFALSKYCIGMQTDLRRLRPEGNNPMIETGLSEIFHSISEIGKWASEIVSGDKYRIRNLIA